MTNEEFLKVRQQIVKEFIITSDNVHMKMLESPMLATRYSNLLVSEKRILDKLKIQLNILKKKLFIKYKGHNNYAISTKSDLETFIFADNEYNEIFTKIQEQELRTNFLKDSIEAFRKLSFTFNTYVEYKKLIEGGN